MRIFELHVKAVSWITNFTLLIILSFVPPSFAEDAPVGSFGVRSMANRQCNQFTFDARRSYSPENQDLTYSWDLGDGTQSEEPFVTHIYEKTGEYTVNLTVTDNSGSQCSQAVTSQVVRVNIPPSVGFEAPEAVCAGQKIALDATESKSKTGEPLNFRWYFSDGTQRQGAKIEKVFTKGGKHTIQLLADDNSGTTCSSNTITKSIEINEPPIAKAGQDVALKCLDGSDNLEVTFDASDSSDSNGDALNYRWDFGDGTEAEGRVVTHKYPESGTYNAKLYVEDKAAARCGVGTDDILVKLERAPQANAGEDISICVNEPALFDGEDSFVENHETLFSRWDFGDGEGRPGLVANHRYKRPGKYLAKLTVQNAFNTKDVACPESIDTRLVTVNSAPKVSIKAVEGPNCVAENVTFQLTSSDPDGDRLEYFWGFGDGTIVRGPAKVTHKYKKGGVYRVSVIADDNKESPCSSVSDTLMVKVNTPPVADAGDNLVCCVGKNNVFNALNSKDPDGDPISYKWVFGDGTTSYDAMASHTYDKSGQYKVQLVIDDNTGTKCSSTSTEFIAQVKSAPVPVMTIR